MADFIPPGAWNLNLDPCGYKKLLARVKRDLLTWAFPHVVTVVSIPCFLGLEGPGGFFLFIIEDDARCTDISFCHDLAWP